MGWDYLPALLHPGFSQAGVLFLMKEGVVPN